MVLVAELLRNGLTDFHEIFYVHLVGLRIGCYLFFIPLSDKGSPKIKQRSFSSRSLSSLFNLKK